MSMNSYRVWQSSILILLVITSGCVSGNAVNDTVTVTRVVDGDTFKVGEKYIRLIGIDTPEKNEEYYNESTQILKNLIEGKEVVIERDKKNKDWYGRFLRYVYIDDIFVNRYMMDHGYAELKTILPNDKYEELLNI